MWKSKAKKRRKHEDKKEEIEDEDEQYSNFSSSSLFSSSFPSPPSPLVPVPTHRLLFAALGRLKLVDLLFIIPKSLKLICSVYCFPGRPTVFSSQSISGWLKSPARITRGRLCLFSIIF